MGFGVSPVGRISKSKTDSGNQRQSSSVRTRVARANLSFCGFSVVYIEWPLLQPTWSFRVLSNAKHIELGVLLFIYS